jgi:hypothetical protein
MASLSRVISQLLDSKLIILNHFHPGQRSVLSEWTLNSGYGFTSMHAMLLLNDDHRLIECPIYPIMAFHTASLLKKELIAQSKKCSNGLMLMVFTGLTTAPTILGKLGMAF